VPGAPEQPHKQQHFDGVVGNANEWRQGKWKMQPPDVGKCVHPAPEAAAEGAQSLRGSHGRSSAPAADC